MTSRRILLYSDGPQFSGGERYLLELIRGLPRDRYVPELVASEEGAVDGFIAEAQALGARTWRLPAIPTLSSRGELLKVFRYFWSRAPRLVHFNLVDPRACNGAMVAAWTSLRRRFIVTEHLPGSPFDAGRLPFRHRVAQRHTVLTIVNSHALENVVLNRPYNRSRVAVVPNGIADVGGPTPELRLTARAALRAPDDALIVGFVARLAPQKHPDLLLEGARRVVDQLPRVHFRVLGDGPELEALHARVAALGLEERVSFLGHRKDARDLMYGMDLLVNTSHYEGQPFSILEAMMAGVPTLAPAIPGMNELISEGVNGLTYTPGDGDALGHALREMLGDPAALATMSATARERALTLHSAETMGLATARLYDAVCSTRSS